MGPIAAAQLDKPLRGKGWVPFGHVITTARFSLKRRQQVKQHLAQRAGEAEQSRSKIANVADSQSEKACGDNGVRQWKAEGTVSRFVANQKRDTEYGGSTFVMQ